MRVVFAGTPAFAVPCLNALLEADSVELVGVCTGPDRPAGRGRKRRPSPVKEFIATTGSGVPVFQFESLREPSAHAELRRLNPDLIVVTAYGRLLPASLLALPPLGCVNVHASLLPRWRGAAPIQRAIQAGDAATGVTLMGMDAGLDTGPILAQARIPIAGDETGGGLHDKLARLGAEMLAANLPALAAGSLRQTPQVESLACYAPKLEKAEAPLDWRLEAAALARTVRAFHPQPAALAVFAGVPLKVLQARSDTAGGARPAARPGQVVAADPSGIAVATGRGMLVLTEVQKPGGVPMSAGALLNGMAIAPGMRFADAFEA